MKHAWELEGDAFGVRFRGARFCNFGITELAAVITTLVASAGVGAATAGVVGTIGASAIGGAALGAGSSALMGKDVGKGALYGGITGGALGAAGPIASGLGVTSDIGTTAISGMAGAAGGAAGSAATGADPGKGALMGGASGLAQGAMSALSKPVAAAPGAAPAAGGTTSAATTAAPAGVPTTGPDITAPVESVTVTGSAPSAGANLGGAGAAVAGPPGAGAKSPTGEDKGSLASPTTPGTVGAGAASGTPSLASGVNTPSNLAPGTGNLAPMSMKNFDPAVGTTLGGADAAAGAGPGATGLDATALASSGGPTTSVGKFIENPGVGTGYDVLSSNAGLALAAGGLGANLLMGNKKPEGIAPIQGEAQAQLAQGKQMQSYITSGQLPPGMQANINAQTQAAEAAIRQRYANMGMSGSTAEMQDIHAARLQAAGATADMATKLFQAGTQQSALGTDLYNELLKINMEQDQNLSNAVGNFVSSFAGMSQTPRATPNSATGVGT